MGYEVEQRVERVGFGVVEERAELGRGPDHDRRGDFACLAPAGHPRLGPQQRPWGSTSGQLDVGRGVVGDQSEADRVVERGPQGGADPLFARRANRSPSVDRLLLLGSAGGAEAADGLVVDFDPVEKVIEIGDAEPVEAQMADRRVQVETDVGLVAGSGRLADPSPAGQPGLEPGCHADPRIDAVAAVRAVTEVVDLGQRAARAQRLDDEGCSLLTFGGVGGISE